MGPKNQQKRKVSREMVRVVQKPYQTKSRAWTYSPPPIMAAAPVREEKGNMIATLQANPTERQEARG